MTAIIGGVLLAAGVVLFVLEPVFSGQRARLYDGDDVYDDASAKRRIALTALRDLEYDRATGKVDGEDYEILKADLSKEALRHLEDQERAGTHAQGDRALPDSVEHSSQLEAEIARIRIALREGLACSSCETVNRSGSQFCIECGQALPAQDPVEAEP
ncbi:MAG: hypothetical protein ACR2QM_10540 [Longimicrobiales bacterium]